MRNMRLASMIAALAFASTTVCAPLISEAQTVVASRVTGQIIDRQSNLPVQGATVTLVGGATTGATATTDASGTYVFNGLVPGVYALTVDATGYQGVRSTEVAVASGGTGTISIALARGIGSSNLKEIGNTTNRGAAQTLQTGSTITRDIDSTVIQRENQIRIADSLQNLPGVTLQGQSSSVGDDIYVNIRGLKPSESQLLLDGHPIGPIGVFSGNGGGYNLQDSPSFALRDTQVVFGAGQTGLYGTTAIGGTVDLQTIDATVKPSFLARYGLGDQGRQLLVLQATGTTGKLGYAFVHGVEGTYGSFATSQRAQTGDTGTTADGIPDLTSATQQGLTYATSANYILHNDLGKLVYSFSPNVRLALTSTIATSWDDKTGNGDNDFVTPEFQAANAPTGSQNGVNCPNGVVVATNANPGGQCDTVAQYAAATSGPAGGGSGAYQAIQDQDYHARLSADVNASNTLTLDSYINNYNIIYHHDLAPGFSNYNFSLNQYRTYGNLVADTFTTGNNELGAGVYFETQNHNSNQTQGGVGAQPVFQPTLTQSLTSYFLRDDFTFNSQVSAYFNSWLQHSTVTNATYFDPRLSLVFRPTPRDVVRVTAGKTDGVPNISLLTGAPSFSLASGNLNCSPAYTVGGGSNPNLVAETSGDLEVAVGHRFYADTSLNVDLYDTNVKNQIFSGAVPASTLASQFPAGLVNSYITQTNKCIVADRVADVGNLFVSTTFNAAGAQSKGFEVSGRLRATPGVYFEGYYDVSSTIERGIPDNLLVNPVTGKAVNGNRFLTNGSQVAGVPLQKATLSIDVSNTYGLEARLDEHYISSNNDLNRPAYTYADAFISQALNRTTALNLGVSNLFNNATDDFGRIGYGTTGVYNPFYAATGSNDPAINGSERFGLVPRSFILTLEKRI